MLTNMVHVQRPRMLARDPLEPIVAPTFLSVRFRAPPSKRRVSRCTTWTLRPHIATHRGTA